jgi:hypothetical protein
LFHGTEFRVVFSFAGVFGREFREISSIFCSTEQNSEFFSLPRKGSERNSEIFCSAEQPEFRRKEPFVPSIPRFAELFFCRKFPTLARVYWPLLFLCRLFCIFERWSGFEPGELP